MKHHLVPCQAWEGQGYCFVVAEKPNGPWSLEPDGLQNFYYQWGFSYRLLVARPSLSAHDAPPQGLRVVKVAKKTRVPIGTQFELTVDPRLALAGTRSPVEIREDGGRLLMGPTFKCATQAVCEEIDERLTSDRPFVITFAFGFEHIRAEKVADQTTETKKRGPPASTEPPSVETKTATSTPATTKTSTAGKTANTVGALTPRPGAVATSTAAERSSALTTTATGTSIEREVR